MKVYPNDELKMDYNSISHDSKKPINVFIIETDSEIKALYKQFFNTIASNVSYTLVDDIRKTCVDNSNSNSTRDVLDLIKQSLFDMIIIDINADSYDRIEIAKEILKSLPQQQLIFTTTSDLSTLKLIMNSHALSYSIPVLQKPFKLTKLLSFIHSSRGIKFDKLKLTDHVLASYNDLQEELMDAVNFIKKGINSDELNLLLIRNDMDINNTITILKSKGLANVDTLLEDKSMIIQRNEEWYISDGMVDKYKIISQWHELVNQSIKSGKKGLRAFCMMDCFFENGFSREVVDYESTLPSQFEIPFVPICAYRQCDLNCLSEQEKKKLIECHNHVIIN